MWALIPMLRSRAPSSLLLNHRVDERRQLLGRRSNPREGAAVRPRSKAVVAMVVLAERRKAKSDAVVYRTVEAKKDETPMRRKARWRAFFRGVHCTGSGPQN